MVPTRWVCPIPGCTYKTANKANADKHVHYVKHEDISPQQQLRLHPQLLTEDRPRKLILKKMPNFGMEKVPQAYFEKLRELNLWNYRTAEPLPDTASSEEEDFNSEGDYETASEVETDDVKQ